MFTANILYSASKRPNDLVEEFITEHTERVILTDKDVRCWFFGGVSSDTIHFRA